MSDIDPHSVPGPERNMDERAAQDANQAAAAGSQAPPQPRPAAPQPVYAAPPPAAFPVPPYIPPKKRTGGFFWGALSGCLLAMVLFFVFGVLLMISAGDRGSHRFSTGARIAVVPIEGEIVDARDIIDAIHRYEENDDVKGIVIRINSPGGAIAPSQEIYEEIRKVRRKSGKPFVASLDSVAASGGFYIAAACDHIVANPGSITGSIGVILQWMNVEDLLRWAKLKPETITSGPMKDAGSPYRALTDAEKQYFQRIVVQLQKQFVHAVAEGRSGRISEADVAKLADGRVFTGEEAKSLKLVDELGNLGDAVAATARLAGLKKVPDTIYPRRRVGTLFDLLTRSDDTETLLRRIVDSRAGRFLFRWQ
jgi:protease-4